jgi:predicted enzyme related to lactoylglutathione lyase
VAVTARLNYVELPAADLSASKVFYEQAFGWQMMAYGPTYAATSGRDTNLGLQADLGEAPAGPLPVITVDDLEAALTQTLAAGGILTVPIFAFPGGRRFQVRDPGGNEIAVSQYGT